MIKLAAFNILGALAIVTMADYALSLPTVYTSHSTGQCVSVVADKGVLFDFRGYDCGNLPRSYDHRWAR
jgi:hypothetical protein